MGAPFKGLKAYIGIRQLRVNFPPRVFKTMTSVRVEHDGIVADVELRRVPSKWKGSRLFLGCPNCGRNCAAVGVAGNPAKWCCCARGCGGWRGRLRILSPRSKLDL